MRLSGMADIGDLTSLTGTTADKLSTLIENEWSGTNVDVLTQRALGIVKKQMIRSLQGMDGIAPELKSVSITDLIHHIVEIDSESGNVRMRRLLQLPFYTVGTCACCLTHVRSEVLGALNRVRHAGINDAERNATTLEERRAKLFRDLPALGKEKSATLEAICKHMDESEAKGEVVDLMSLMIPQYDTPLQSVAVLKSKKGKFTWEVRLACVACLDRLTTDKDGLFYSIRQAQQVGMIWNSLRNIRDDKTSMDNFGVIKALRVQGEKFAKKATTLLDVAHTARKQGVKNVLSGKHLRADEIDQFCQELIDAGLEDLVWVPKTRKGRKPKFKELKKGTKYSDAVASLEDVRAIGSELDDIDSLLGLSATDELTQVKPMKSGTPKTPKAPSAKKKMTEEEGRMTAGEGCFCPPGPTSVGDKGHECVLVKLPMTKKGLNSLTKAKLFDSYPVHTRVTGVCMADKKKVIVDAIFDVNQSASVGEWV
jgi:hypothetical protein